MQSKRKLQIGIGFGFVGLLAPVTNAQTFTEITREGAPVPGVPGENVSRIDHVDINNNGDWLIELDSDAADSNADHYLIHNGTVLHQQGTSTGINSPVGAVMGSFVDVVDINDNGDIMTTIPAVRSDGSSTTLLIRNGITLIEDDVTPCGIPGMPAGTFYSGVSEAWQNNNGQILFAGNVALGGTGSTSILVRIDLDGAGNIMSETKVAMAGETLTGPNHVTPIQGFSFSKARNGINDSGDYWWYVDDDHTVAPGSTLSDANIYVNQTLLYNEADPFPTPGNTFTFDHFSTAEIDMNIHGDFVFAGFDRDPDSSNDSWIYKVEGGILTVLAHEGEPVPASIPGTWNTAGFGFGGIVPMSNNGDVLWFLDWDDPDTTIDTALLYNNNVVILEGVTDFGGILVNNVPNGDNEVAMSDNGQRAITESELDGSIDIVHTVILVDSVGSAYCDPANNNSTGGPGVLTAEGSTTASFNNVTLNVSGLPTGEFGFFLNGTGNDVVMNAGGSSGNLCVSTAIGRYNGASEIFNTGMTGTGSLTLDLTNTPTPMTPTSIMAGQTWYFQCWYRDTPDATSNFTNGLQIDFL